jgi:hypothetical protein
MPSGPIRAWTFSRRCHAAEKESGSSTWSAEIGCRTRLGGLLKDYYRKAA